ncbi:arginine decarboxylase [Klebsiella aerogenes]|nr:arginine decarboxylase [Klebsiella aerogenes]ELA2606832.1 arginine decarboxylase [Klebsiella aerogenes]HEO1675007.1 arginine decarboxylase [Klebsiella aerogenes]
MSINDKHHFPVLIISECGSENDMSYLFNMVRTELEKYNHHFIFAHTEEAAMALIRQESGAGCVIINDCGTGARNTSSLFFTDIVRTIRQKNRNLPIFFSSTAPALGRLPIDVIKELHESINVGDDSPVFIAGRIHLALKTYVENLLPPYFSALKKYALDSPYYWDCPGHQGGVAYLKHPVGKEFIDFFGENLMRADIGISTPEMGDWLEHKGAPEESEKRAARLFGADKTFYVTGGSSQSNQIVGHSLDLKDKVVLVDRNCHKSVNHELTITQANPVYFQPARNGFGIIGLITPEQFTARVIGKKISDSILAGQAQEPEPVYAIITNCTYDGLIYDVTSLTDMLGETVPRIKFDEAWYAYAAFHPLYQGRFAMDVPQDRQHGPTLFAVQSTHKMLAALSSASMIHIRSNERAPVNYDVFNEAFMMHGTTSPFYPIIASIDVATSMMDGAAGKTLLDEAIHDAICFRKTLISVADRLKASGPEGWFFGIWQPDTVLIEGDKVSFVEANDDVLANNPDCWFLKTGELWHGFEGLPHGYAMLDPLKVTITCPGLDAQGNMYEFGIPAPVVVKYLDTQRIVPARNGDYTILILFALGSTLGKWNTLIDSLIMFKHHYDINSPLTEVLPEVAVLSDRYASMGLRDLCQAIHYSSKELDIAGLAERACAAEAVPVLNPSQAYEYLTSDQTELVKVENIRNRTLAVMVTPYPPGIPLIMPGEKMCGGTEPIIHYLLALQTFGQRFPGFEHELQGVEIDELGVYLVRCIREKPEPVKKVCRVVPLSSPLH